MSARIGLQMNSHIDTSEDVAAHGRVHGLLEQEACQIKNPLHFNTLAREALGFDYPVTHKHHSL